MAEVGLRHSKYIIAQGYDLFHGPSSLCSKSIHINSINFHNVFGRVVFSSSVAVRTRSGSGVAMKYRHVGWKVGEVGGKGHTDNIRALVTC